MLARKRMKADRISRFYSLLLAHPYILRKDWRCRDGHICTEFSVVCLITLVGHVGAMVQYVKAQKYKNVDGEYGVCRRTERCSCRCGCHHLFFDNVFPKREEQCPHQLKRGLEPGYRVSTSSHTPISKRQPNELLHSQET
jgi:hypothetical protein